MKQNETDRYEWKNETRIPSKLCGISRNLLENGRKTKKYFKRERHQIFGGQQHYIDFGIIFQSILLELHSYVLSYNVRVLVVDCVHKL